MQILDRLAGVVEANGRELQSLGKDVSRGGHDPAGRAATKVGDVDQGPGEPFDAALTEDGPEDQQVVRVDPAAKAVVHHEHVARTHRADVVVLEHRGQRTAEARRVHQVGRRRERHQATIAIKDPGAGIGPLGDHRGVGRVDDDDARLLRGDPEGVAEDLGFQSLVVRLGHRRFYSTGLPALWRRPDENRRPVGNWNLEKVQGLPFGESREE